MKAACHEDQTCEEPVGKKAPDTARKNRRNSHKRVLLPQKEATSTPGDWDSYLSSRKWPRDDHSLDQKDFKFKTLLPATVPPPTGAPAPELTPE